MSINTVREIANTDLQADLEKLGVDDDLNNLDALLNRFNIFKAIGVVHQEILHSNFLSFLLDPSESHKLGDTFLKGFLLNVLAELNAVDFSDIEVRREWKYIDILVHSPKNKLVCAIENKIYSQEHSDQLSRYREVVRQAFKDDYRHIFIYLTPSGSRPAKEEDQHWLSYSYAQVADVIDGICPENSSTINSEVHLLMTHYSRLLRRDIVADSKTSEVDILCQTIYQRHKKALDVIYQHRQNLDSSLPNFLKQLVVQSKGVEYDSKFKNLIRVAVKDWDAYPFQKTCTGWTWSKRILMFELEVAPSGIFLYLTLGPSELSTRQNIYQALKDSSVLGFQDNKPVQKSGWVVIFKQPILEDLYIEGFVEQALKDKIQDAWDCFLNNELPLIKQAMANHAPLTQSL